MADSDVLDGSEVWLCGQPYSRRSLERAEHLLSGLETYAYREERYVLPSVLAARAAVREALREDFREEP